MGVSCSAAAGPCTMRPVDNMVLYWAALMFSNPAGGTSHATEGLVRPDRSWRFSLPSFFRLLPDDCIAVMRKDAFWVRMRAKALQLEREKHMFKRYAGNLVTTAAIRIPVTVLQEMGYGY